MIKPFTVQVYVQPVKITRKSGPFSTLGMAQTRNLRPVELALGSLIK